MTFRPFGLTPEQYSQMDNRELQKEIHALLGNLVQLMAHQCEVLEDIRESLNQANESDPDAEPDPFQTLNGPTA